MLHRSLEPHHRFRVIAVHERTGKAHPPLDGDQRGTINRSLLTENAKSYFTVKALKDFSARLRPLGKSLESTEVVKRHRSGLTLWRYNVKFAKTKIQVWVRDLPDGKIEEYQVFATEGPQSRPIAARQVFS